ncbi:MAG TPA: adenylyl-sulfate kinase [Verrucomicrobiae bacterium]|jgi:bifunctional enzyme CysN/CysC|nr:adenylyl-sulfate kinase [Verrucomicrobiae bacterium]
MQDPRVNAPTEQLKIVIVGHVDHGKSTLVGRLFHDTGSLPDGKLEQLRAVAERRGVPFEWANLMDALQSERDQNITIDTSQIWFQTHKRQYVIIDAPGHKEFLKNMITGAANAEAALLLIDAGEGVQEQSRRHGYLLSLLGIRQIVVLVNKMDLCDYSQARFNEIETQFRAFLASVGVEPKSFLPIAARHGDNIATRGDKLSWWNGPTVLEALDQFEAGTRPVGQELRFPIQDVYRFDERRILAGRVESGTLKVGDRLIFSPTNKVSTVKTIERWNAPPSAQAQAGESIGITLAEQVFVARGAVGALETAPPYELARFKARVFWLGRAAFQAGKTYKLKLATQEAECEIDSIQRLIDSSTLETIHRDEAFVGRNEVAELTLHAKRPVAFDVHSDIAATGRFVIVDGFEVSGGGIIADDSYPRRTADSLQKSHNIYWSHGKVTAAHRAARNRHRGRVIWLTGLSASGKSTIATELEGELFNLGRHVYILDGDNMRHGLCTDLGFSPKDRKENIRRVGESAKLFADAGIICITAFISPYRSDRDLVRQILPAGQFIEVYVNAPLAVCEARDPKGLYAKARAHEIKEFTGISAPYEAPERPELELHTDLGTVQESVTRVIDYLNSIDSDTDASA